MVWLVTLAQQALLETQALLVTLETQATMVSAGRAAPRGRVDLQEMLVLLVAQVTLETQALLG